MNKSNTKWVVIRDFEYDIMIMGYISSFSVGLDDREEVFLNDVTVYKNSTKEKYYGIPAMYFSSPKGKLFYEFPSYKIEKDKGEKDESKATDIWRDEKRRAKSSAKQQGPETTRSSGGSPQTGSTSGGSTPPYAQSPQ